MSTRAGTERLNLVLAALADPTRRTLFQTVIREPGVTTSQLATRAASMTRWGVIKHLAVLRDAGLIQTMATGRLRRHYAEKSTLDPLRTWLDALPSR